jgi:hypothetical protein
MMRCWSFSGPHLRNTRRPELERPYDFGSHEYRQTALVPDSSASRWLVAISSRRPTWRNSCL